MLSRLSYNLTDLRVSRAADTLTLLFLLKMFFLREFSLFLNTLNKENDWRQGKHRGLLNPRSFLQALLRNGCFRFVRPKGSLRNLFLLERLIARHQWEMASRGQLHSKLQLESVACGKSKLVLRNLGLKVSVQWFGQDCNTNYSILYPWNEFFGILLQGLV